MSFSADERAQMLALKGVGPTVVQRLEEAGFSSLAQLAGMDALAITRQISQMMRSTCWHNSPQARGAIGAIVSLAGQGRPAAR
ncbi:MAG: helix-hairpin-helix domain-containing protein [Ottowia sp.]|jgi:nucleotidyltransferase/DNA polymerase involved in DNA repair|nr:helix-hairpin-helix domain-containing protein [Ottowia sp.]